MIRLRVQFYMPRCLAKHANSTRIGNEAARVVKEPPFIEAMSQDRWGFVVFKSHEIVDAARWAACKERFLQIVLDTLDPYRGRERLDECISNMSFQWVEDIRKGDGDIPSIAR